MSAEIEHGTVVAINLTAENGHSTWHGLEIDASEYQYNVAGFINLVDPNGNAFGSTVKRPNYYDSGEFETVTVLKGYETVKMFGKEREKPIYEERQIPKMIANGGNTLLRATDYTQYSRDVSNGWTDIQDADVMAYMQQLIDAAQAEGMTDFKLSTAGSLREGQMTFLTALTGDEFSIRSNGRSDQTKNRFSLINQHKYGTSLQALIGAIRVECANTVALSLKDAKAGEIIRVNHRMDFSQAQKDITTYLASASNAFARFKTYMEFLALVPMSDDEVKAILAESFPVEGKNLRKKEESKMARDIFEIYQSGASPASDVAPNTAYQAVQAVTYWADHISGYDDDASVISANMGVNSQKKTDFISNLLSFAKYKNDMPTTDAIEDNGFGGKILATAA